MRRVIASGLRLAFVAAAAWAFWELLASPTGTLDHLWARGLTKVALWVVPALVLTRIVVPGAWRAAARSLGLLPLAGSGSLLMLAASAPFGLALLMEFRRWPGVDALLGDVLLGPFAEEVLFRGFLFLGLRALGWRFWPAAVVSAVAFGAAHATVLPSLLEWTTFAFYFGDGLWTLLPTWGNVLTGIVQVSAGGMLFAWISERWRSVWPAVALHAAINFWWVLAYGPEGGPAAGPLGLSPWAVASALTLAAVVGLTLRYAPRTVRDGAAREAQGQWATSSRRAAPASRLP